MAETIATKYMIEASSVYIGTEEREKKVIPINIGFFNPDGYYKEDTEMIINKFIDTCSNLSIVRGTGHFGLIRIGDHTFVAANDERDWILVLVMIPIV